LQAARVEIAEQTQNALIEAGFVTERRPVFRDRRAADPWRDARLSFLIGPISQKPTSDPRCRQSGRPMTSGLLGLQKPKRNTLTIYK
jgi:hypothetical protein